MDSFLLSRTGAQGADGLGAVVPATGPGQVGGRGAPGEAVQLGFTGLLAADPAGTALLDLHATGGGGGRGGQGQPGEDGLRSLTSVTTAAGPRETLSFGPGANGGAGGPGGRGGQAVASATGAEFTGWATVIALLAQGGQGSAGGAGGLGGFGGYGLDTSETGPGGTSFSQAIPGLAGLAGPAGAGGLAGLGRAALSQALVTGGAVTISLEAAGGQGGAGGMLPPGAGFGPAASNLGASPAPGPAGARGGDGAPAAVEVVDLRVVGASLLTLDLRAFGGAGGKGGAGGAGTARFDDTRHTATDAGGAFSVLSEHYLSTYGDGGAGGDGGLGGKALAVLAGAAITMDATSNLVAILLRAEAGRGGEAGLGGPGTPDGSGAAWTDIGSAPGLPGQAGADGGARLLMTRTTIALGDDNDVLRLSLVSDTPQVVLGFGRNEFHGGEGLDTFSLAGSSWAGAFDVGDERVSLRDLTPRNIMTGFESFEGTDHADIFRDGVGNQTYAGGAGGDRFVFGRLHGRDLILDFGPGDVIELRRFGPVMDGFDDVLARATQNGANVRIDTALGNRLTLAGVELADLRADWFLFS